MVVALFSSCSSKDQVGASPAMTRRPRQVFSSVVTLKQGVLRVACLYCQRNPPRDRSIPTISNGCRGFLSISRHGFNRGTAGAGGVLQRSFPKAEASISGGPGSTTSLFPRTTRERFHASLVAWGFTDALRAVNDARPVHLLVIYQAGRLAEEPGFASIISCCLRRPQTGADHCRLELCGGGWEKPSDHVPVVGIWISDSVTTLLGENGGHVSLCPT